VHFDALVLLEPPVLDLRAAVAEGLRPFRRDDDAPSPQARWDAFLLTDGPFTHVDAAALVGGTDDDTLHAVCPVARLPEGYNVAAVVTPLGEWHDLEDTGWRLLDGHSPRNQDALARWRAHVADVLARYPYALGVHVHCHS